MLSFLVKTKEVRDVLRMKRTSSFVVDTAFSSGSLKALVRLFTFIGS